MPPFASAIRTSIAALLAVPVTLFFSSLTWLSAKVLPRTLAADRAIRGWARSLLFLAGARLSVEGLENIDPTCQYMVVANHQSNLDIMACFSELPLQIRFIAKKEVFKIPVLAAAMRSVGIISLDRQSTGPTAMRELNRKAAEVVKRGHSLIAYPEGTRSTTKELLPFKKGAFVIAAATGIPILPVTIQGAREMWAPGSKLIRSGKIRLLIDPPLPTEGLKKRELDELRDKVRDMIADRYRQLQS